jgi:hypothetical protein
MKNRSVAIAIDLEIRRSGTGQLIKAGFEYRHAVVSAKPLQPMNKAQQQIPS